MNSVPCIQINMHNAMLASVQLSQHLGAEPTIAFITEPYTAYNKIVSLPLGYNIFPQTPLDPAPRAGLAIPSYLPVVFLSHLSCRDSAVALVTIGTTKYVLVSGYCDITLDPVPQWLSDCVKYASDNDHQLIVSLDTNAHSGFFGPQDNNRRGDAMEEFILMNGLLVHNQGDIPTFEVVRGQRTLSSFIDVTLTLGVDYLLDWHVSRAFNASDHNSILFQIPVAPSLLKRFALGSQLNGIFLRHFSTNPFIPQKQ